MSTPLVRDNPKGYQTRHGRPVRIYAWDCGGIFPIHGAVLMDSKEWKPYCWRETGHWAFGGETGSDIFPIMPKKVTKTRYGIYDLYMEKLYDRLWIPSELRDQYYSKYNNDPKRYVPCTITYEIEE